MTVPFPRDGHWLAIEAEARAQVTAELIAAEQTPLEQGAPIAWNLTRKGGVSIGLSPLHFVGKAELNRQRTTCGIAIPEPVRWLPMSPAIARTMRLCPACEAEMSRVARERAA